MSIIKSKKKAVETPQADAKSLAHAYDMKRRNKSKMAAKPKMMAKGGEIENRGTEVIPDKGHGKIIIIDNAKKESQMLAQGGPVAPKPKIQATKPRMANSSVIKAKPVDALGNVLEDREEHLMELTPEKHEGMSEDHTQPVDEYMKDQAEMFARGGEIEMPDHEVEEEHHNSIAAAIMAKRRKDSMSADSESDIDHEMMMAEGGQVDIDSNNEEQPNGFYNRNEHAALKENYDSDMDDVSQPDDSNEHGDDIDSDKHDMITVIRRKMKSRKQF